MLACTALVGCTNEDELVNNENENQQKGDKAYVMVKINNTESISSRGWDGGFTDGNADEHAIKTVNFYFYSAEGTFVTEGEVWKNPIGNEETTQTAIEWQTNVAVALQNLTQKGTPKYVLAVLNKPASLNLANKSIADVQKELLTAATNNETNGKGFLVDTESDKKYFIMSNSTYNGGDEVDGIAYFATAIDEDQFFKEPQEASEYSKNPVEIYVERLAAKTQLNIGQTEGVVTVTEDGVACSAYPLNKVKVSAIGTDGEMAVTETQLYAQVYGWDLNATQKQTYLMKNVPAWDSDNLAFGWDDQSNYRANWCLSPNYGTGTYPANYLTTDADLSDDDANTYTLNYVNWASLSNTVGAVDYCAENTNNVDILMSNAQNFHATVTEILVKARIVEEGETKGEYVPVTLFRYDNVLYRENGYLERLFAKVKPQIYRKETTGEGESAKTEKIYISSEDVKYDIVNEGDGKVSVKFTGAADNTTYTWYEGEDTEVTAADLAVKLNIAFKVLFDKERDPQQASYVLADHYNGGMMYYNIPIEHLRKQAPGIDGTNTGNPYNEDGEIDVLEAEYGVVRNHWYQVTVNSIKNLGTAVHDEDEDIIPDESNNVLYYIAARINVLSWKVVRQGVDL